MTAPLLIADGLSKRYGAIQACRDISFELEEGEALAIVGESGSGKTTLLHLIAGLLAPDAGAVRYRVRDGALRDLAALTKSERRALMRTDWGFVHQDSSRGLRMNVSAGGNIGERWRWATAITAASAVAPNNGSSGSKSRPIASTTGLRPFPAACGSGCRSRATL